MHELLPIGEVARRSGLSVSALRFYDGEDVLRPAAVDPSSGYRRYDPDQVRTARLVAGLRRVGVPLTEIREAVRHQDDHELVTDLLDRHQRRLERGLDDARREIDRLRIAFAGQADTAAALVATSDLRRLVDAVRFAVGHDPEFPVLNGALLEIDDGALRLVATDRFRLAFHEVPADTAGSARGVVPDLALRDLAALLDEADQRGPATAELTLHPDGLDLSVAGRSLHAALVEGDYPDYRRLIDRDEPPHTPWDDHDVQVGIPEDGLVTLVGEDASVIVRHEFLLEAVAAARTPATLGLDGPISPLAVRAADGAMSLLMPVRPEHES